MEIKLNNKTFKSGAITIGLFQKATELAMKWDDLFTDDGFLTAEGFKEGKEVVVAYFNNQFTEEDLDNYEIQDGIDFINLINRVMNNIQMNEGRRKEIEEARKGKAKK